MSSDAPSLESEIAKATSQLSVKRRQCHQQSAAHTEELIKSLIEVADLRVRAKDMLRAGRLYREADMHGEEAHKIISPIVRVRTKAKRGFLLERTGQIENAIQCYESGIAITIEEDVAYAEVRATMHNNLAVLHKRLNAHEKAEFHYKSALVILESLDGEVGNKIGTLCNNLGVYYAGLGKLNNAFRLFRRGLRMRRLFFQDDSHPAVQQSLKNLGATYRALGRNEEANECFEKIPAEEVITFLEQNGVETQAEELEQITA